MLPCLFRHQCSCRPVLVQKRLAETCQASRTDRHHIGCARCRPDRKSSRKNGIDSRLQSCLIVFPFHLRLPAFLSGFFLMLFSFPAKERDNHRRADCHRRRKRQDHRRITCLNPVCGRTAVPHNNPFFSFDCLLDDLIFSPNRFSNGFRCICVITCVKRQN